MNLLIVNKLSAENYLFELVSFICNVEYSPGSVNEKVAPESKLATELYNLMPDNRSKG